MSSTILTRQLILDASGKPIGVILSIEEYRELVGSIEKSAAPDQLEPGVPHLHPSRSLYGALSGLGGKVASTECIDQDLHELWAAWDKAEDS
jgi:hypothetical protein